MIEPISPLELEKYVPDDETMTRINTLVKENWNGVASIVPKSPSLDYVKLYACFELYKKSGWIITERDNHYIFTANE